MFKLSFEGVALQIQSYLKEISGIDEKTAATFTNDLVFYVNGMFSHMYIQRDTRTDAEK